jgi:uncharacterized membrane protein SpoIIM required for sporulation
VNLDAFVRDRSEAWSRLDTLVRDARRRAESLGPEGVLELGSLYRAAAADLALGRRAFPGDPVVARLERLVAAARTLVYAVPSRRGGLRRFVTHGYWRLVAERWVVLALAAALLFGPALLSGAWALDDPGAAAGLVPTEFQSVTEPRPEGQDLGLAPDEEAAFSAAIMTNNIRVSLFAFAAGILAGLGTAAVLILNGVLLGAVGGLAVGAGNGRPFFELVAAHGVLELSCILVAGAAGLRFGWALVEPGTGTRGDALRREARPALALVLGTAPWLVVAGLVEGFVTPAGIGLTGALAVGFALATVYWGLVVFLGRRSRAGLEPSLADMR